MAALSISKAWDETKAITARDGRLIAAVALALFVFPGVVLDLSMPEPISGKLPPPGPWIAIAAVVILISLAGQLAVIRLAMGPQLTVGEAIRDGIRRLPFFVGAAFLWSLPFVLVGSILAIQLAGKPDNPSPAVSVALLALTAVMVFFWVRFILIPPVASAEKIGPFGILRRSWDLTGGHWWHLFGFLMLFAVAVITLLLAVEAVTGIVARLLLGQPGPWTVGGLLVALVSQLLSAAAYSVFFVMLARIYVQLSGHRSATGAEKSGT